MCGRFTLRARLNDLLAEWGYEQALEYAQRYNIAPTQQIPIIAAGGAPKLVKWGLIPSWAAEPKIGSSLINARAETVAEKPAFRSAFKRGRCLIVADGFIEWKKEGDVKQPYFIRMKDDRPFTFAGLSERWSKVEPPIDSATIITTEANPLMAGLHDRMPVILPPDARALWLDPEFTGQEKLLSLLQPYPDDDLIATPVSRFVNSPNADDPRCLNPL
ncbi:MAG: SOS response-associated peptidase [Planctomycetia bacterium]|nr:SOS response-associated peptidase [Planctomycetia bacterium]